MSVFDRNIEAIRLPEHTAGGGIKSSPAVVPAQRITNPLVTERLALRAISSDDVESLFELDSDPEVVRFSRLDGRSPSLEEVRDEILPRMLAPRAQDPGVGFWAAIERSSGEFVGWFHLRPPAGASTRAVLELGYRLRRASWGRGYATEGSKVLIELGFGELGAHRIEATALAENTASIRVMEKCGLRFIETFTYPNNSRPAIRYACHNPAWPDPAVNSR